LTRIVDERDSLPSLVFAPCPSCGLFTADSPHGTSEECIGALEAEVHKLSELLERLKKAPTQKTPALRETHRHLKPSADG